MRTSCLAVLLLASLAPAADPPAKSVNSTSEVGELLTKQGYTAIPLTIPGSERTFLLRVTLDGHPFTLMVDTGCAGTISLTKAAGKTLGLSCDTHVFEGDVGSVAITGKKYGKGTVAEVTFDGTDYRAKGAHDIVVWEGLTFDITASSPKEGKDRPLQVDGLLGQQFLLDHSAVIEHATATLYLIPMVKKDGPKLVGRWECIGGERDGKPLGKVSERWIEFRENGLVGLQLDGITASGYRTLRTRGVHRELFVGVRGKDDTTTRVAYGLYRVEDDLLKLCLIDEPIEPKPNKWEGVTPPTKFEAKKDSGHVYYEFKRVKAEKK